MPSVIGLLEQREVRAREELESWREVLSQAEEEVAAATERAERARVAREELVQALAEEGVGGASPVPVDAGAEAGRGRSGRRRGMPSVRRSGSRDWAKRRWAGCIARCSVSSRLPRSRWGDIRSSRCGRRSEWNPRCSASDARCTTSDGVHRVGSTRWDPPSGRHSGAHRMTMDAALVRTAMFGTAPGAHHHPVRCTRCPAPHRCVRRRPTP